VGKARLNSKPTFGEPMPAITLNAHFDGQKITLDEASDIPPNAKLLVTVLETPDLEQLSWQQLSPQNLARAYSNSQPRKPT
jgi:hypothetical protein